MRFVPILATLLLCNAVPAALADEIQVIKIGDSIALHTREDSALRAYGDGKPFMEWKPEGLGLHEMMWRIGNGVLVTEHTMGAGFIVKISYVVKDDVGNTVATLSVKKYDPVTGEMTIEIPKHTSDSPRRAPVGSPTPTR